MRLVKFEASSAFQKVSTHLNSLSINTRFSHLDDFSQSIYGEQQPKRDVDGPGPSICR
ncbi:hypothetical protein ACSSVV_002316 [Marinobacter sp. MBR-105]